MPADHHPFAGQSPSHGSTEEGSVDARRKARKREQDRRSQRLARQRTKNRIAYLEEVIAELQQNQPDGQYMALRRERDSLAAARVAMTEILGTIDKALQTHRATIEDALGQRIPAPEQASSCASNEPAPGPPAAEDMSRDDDDDDDACLAGHIQVPTPSVDDGFMRNHPLPVSPQSSSSSSAKGRQAMDRVEPSVPPASRPEGDCAGGRRRTHEVIIPSVTAAHSCDCSPTSKSSQLAPLNLWRYANETLVEPCTCCDPDGHRDDELAHDVPVRAVVEGWEAVQKRVGGHLPPSWQKLRRIDETLFRGCGRTERLAILTLMHLLFRYHQTGSPEKEKKLPSWYRPRPSQSIAHSYAIDYFAWPGIRERFVFSQHRYCSNLFWKLFCSDLHILWPFEFRDCYSLNVTTQEFVISHAFNETIRDIRSWAMSPGMFEVWPEFLSDIPTYNSLPPSLLLPEPEQPQFPVIDWGLETMTAGHSEEDAEVLAEGTHDLEDEPAGSDDDSLTNLNYDLLIDLQAGNLGFEGFGSLIFSPEMPR